LFQDSNQQKIFLRAPSQPTPTVQKQQVIYVKPATGSDGKPQLMEVFQNQQTVQALKSPQKIAPRITTVTSPMQQITYRPQGTNQQVVTVQASQAPPQPQYLVVKQTTAQGHHTFAVQPQSSEPAPADYDAYDAPLTHASSKKRCNCTKSQCLKLYCDCFANGEFCQNCNCVQCYNNLEHEEDRSLAVKLCLERNPNAFHPKIGKYKPGDKERRHTKGCNCKRSGCLKNYCECYEARILCSGVCRCVGCHNIEENMDAESLLTIKQDFKYRAPKSKFDETLKQLAGVGETEKVAPAPSLPPKPELKISSELVDATCECLLSRASEASEEQAEKAILQEFGHCLAAIIEAANLRVTAKVK